MPFYIREFNYRHRNNGRLKLNAPGFEEALSFRLFVESLGTAVQWQLVRLPLSVSQ